MVVVLQSVFVTHHLAVQLVNQLIHRSVQISVGTLDKDIRAFDMKVALGSLPTFFFFLLFHREQHLDINDLIEMAHDSVKLAGDVSAQGWSDLKVMAADRQIHKKPPVYTGVEKTCH
jgi:hypothetical protein